MKRLITVFILFVSQAILCRAQVTIQQRLRWCQEACSRPVTATVANPYADAVAYYSFTPDAELADSGTGTNTLTNAGQAGFGDGALFVSKKGTGGGGWAYDSSFVRCTRTTTNKWLSSADGSNYTFSAWYKFTYELSEPTVMSPWSMGITVPTDTYIFRAGGNYTTAPYNPLAPALYSVSGGKAFTVTSNSISGVLYNWIHLVLSVTSNIPTWYLNGAVLTNATANLASLAGVTYWDIGHMNIDWGWTGYIDDWTAWPRGLSSNEVISIYNYGRSALPTATASANNPYDDAFFWYKFTTGATTNDSGLGTNWITKVNAGATFTNNYLKLDGTSGYLQCVKPTTNHWITGTPAGHTNVTINLWLNSQVTSAGKASWHLFNVYNAAKHYMFCYMGSYSGSYTFGKSNLVFTCLEDAYGGAANAVDNSFTDLNTNRWTMLTAVISDASVCFYTNGIFVPNSFNSVFKSMPISPHTTWEIGRRPDGYYYINGFMDDVACWQRCLSANEIKKLYNTGRSDP